jgi:hypothetical protein
VLKVTRTPPPAPDVTSPVIRSLNTALVGDTPAGAVNETSRLKGVEYLFVSLVKVKEPRLLKLGEGRTAALLAMAAIPPEEFTSNVEFV